MKKNIAICGGGSKGFLLLGTLQKMFDKGLLNNITNYCGTSVGAIICFLLLIGYTPDEIFYVTYKINIDDLLHLNVTSLLKKFGMYSNDPILYVIKSLMRVKNVKYSITFEDLYKKFNKTLAITGVCLNDNSLHFFDHITTPNMQVLMAIKISISIPFMFESVKYDGKIWVDGACLCNYPIQYFKDNIDETIGLDIESSAVEYEDLTTVKDYAMQLMRCILKKNTKDKNSSTIYLNATNVSFVINNDQKINMYNEGYSVNIDNFV